MTPAAGLGAGGCSSVGRRPRPLPAVEGWRPGTPGACGPAEGEAAMAAVQPRDALEEMVGAQRIIEHDRYPFSPRTRGLKWIRAIIEARERYCPLSGIRSSA